MQDFLVRITSRIRVDIGRLWTCRSGNIAILFALSSVVLVLGIGAAVDIGRWLHARDRTLAAIDAAVLAGARALQLDDADMATAVAIAQKFYDQNVTNRLPVSQDTITFTASSDGTSMTANGSAYIETPFLNFISIDKLPLISTATSQFSEAKHGIGENLEISLMLDVTGSMSGDKLDDLKDAANDLINIIEQENTGGYTTKVALVPFSEDIRLPTTSALDKARGTGLPDSRWIPWGWGWGYNYYLSDCVVERTGAQKYTDAPPQAGQYVMGHYTWNYTWSGGKRRGVCSIPENAAILPLTEDVDALRAKVSGLSASGGTAGHLGTAWAWYTLSPNWGSLWSAAENVPEPYGTANLQKIAILMTDGEYNQQYNSNGIEAYSSRAANGSSTTQARALCQGMKDKGIVVYSVGFDLGGPSSTAYQTLKQCASDDEKFYHAEDGTQLLQAFRDIALKLSKLYLSK